MKSTLVKKISIRFLMVVIGSILITNIISNYMIDRKFNSYLLESHKSKVTKIINIIQNLYNKKTGFSETDYEEISRYAVIEDYYIEVRDANNVPILATGKAHLIHQKMMDSIIGKNIDDKMGEYVEEKYPLNIKGEELGAIIIGHFGSFNISEEDIGFIDTLNKSYTISITVALAFGLIVSLIFSKQLTKPLTKLTRVANEMRSGNLKIRSDVSSNAVEIDELSKSINYLAETLQQQEALRKRLTSDMAHEIRTPLTTLNTHIEALMDGIWEPTKERFESCYEEIQRLTKLVDNLKDIAKIEQSNLNLNKEKFNLPREIEKVIETMKPLYEKKNISINLIKNADIDVLMDKDKLKQIMHNLLSNAYKYSNENAGVIVEVGRYKSCVTISIKDTGVGIPSKDLPHIFERFYRGDMSRSRETGGTGIGLTIVKTLVEAHHGKIEVKSEQGKGSVFIITFPESIIFTG